MFDAVLSLEGKRVVVIGGGSGIGFSVAALAQNLGAEVVIATSQAANVEAALGRLPGATGRTVDVRDEGMVATFFEELGAFDHLIMTAGGLGVGMSASTAEIDLDKAREGFGVRFWGAFAAAKHCGRTIAHDGSITLTSGLLGHRPLKGSMIATAVDGAVEHLTYALAIDLAPVRVNAVSPGIILTDLAKEMPAERVQSFTKFLPLLRGGSPEEAATAYIYLMLNGYVTGQILSVDGGGMIV